MGTTTEISWTDSTFNPWIGCEHVSPGCENCYAEAQDNRWQRGRWGHEAERSVTSAVYWRKPVLWNLEAQREGRRRLVFCASLADVFEDRDDLVVPRARLFDLIEATPHLTWQLLTKRPQNVAEMVPASWHFDYLDRVGGWPANAWIGTTVEDQERAEERVPVLLTIPAPVRFLSCEPLLGSVILRPKWIELELQAFGPGGAACFPRVDWIIVGGESGNHFRRLDVDHARSLRDQAREYDVPLWFKQVGGIRPKDGGHLLDGEEIHELPAAFVREVEGSWS